MGQPSALFYKNWLLYKRAPVGNICEIFLPVIFILFIIMIRNLDKPVTYEEQAFITNSRYSRQIIPESSSSPTLK